MNGTELTVSGLCGVVLPFIISFLKTATWPRPYKLALAAGSSVVVAVGVNLIVSNFDLAAVGANTAVVFGTASTVYSTLLEKSGIEAYLREHGVK